MKIKHYMMAALVLMSSCMMSGCKDDDKDSMSKAVLASASLLNFQETSATPQLITVYSDANWVADVPEWVTISPATGTAGTTEVTVSVSDNLREGTPDNPRKAELVFHGSTLASRAFVTIAQEGDKYRDCKDYTVEQLYGATDETYMSIPNAIVVANTATGFVISNADYKSNMLVVSSEAVDKGDNVTLLCQKLTDSQSLAYVVADEITVNSKGNEVTYPEPVNITETIDKYNPTTREYISVEGIYNLGSVAVTGSSLTVTLDNLPESVDYSSLNGHFVRVYGYFAGVAAPIMKVISAEVEDLGEAQNIYFTEDFEWLAQWSAIGNGAPAGQTVEKNADDNALQLTTPKIDGVTAYDALIAKGFEIPAVHDASKSAREPGKQTYLQTNYLKFGLTAYQCGLTLPSIEGIGDGTTVHVSFQWCPMVQGSGTKDPTTLVVVVKNGDNEMMFDVPPHGITPDDPLKWVEADIVLTGATVNKDTKITIRNTDDQWPHSSTRRWFLDNIKVYSPMM
ncbi:MAG: BACON domain-containing protein [Muribaculum sp.]|nr:BACON domain-containing protein [Muribaculum sp.]